MTARSAGAPVASGSGLLRGGAVLGGAMIVANVGNYLLNVLLARWLTPAQFSDANLMVTLMLTATAVALAVQLVAARFVGKHDAVGESVESDRIAAELRRWAWAAGVALGAVLCAGSLYWQAPTC